MIFARRVFTVAGVYGIVVLLPMMFLEEAVARRAPPAFTHPEFYYGFVGVALAWQLVFLLVGRDPARLRPVMLPAVLEKVVWGVGVCILYAQGRTGAFFLGGAVVDLLLAALFVAAWRRTAPADSRA
jgi:hypothetical protein